MKIELTHAEAVVLTDLLYRISQKDEYYEDIAEQYVLWTIEAQLNKVLVEPIMANYQEIIQQNRDIVRKNYQKNKKNFSLY